MELLIISRYESGSNHSIPVASVGLTQYVVRGRLNWLNIGNLAAQYIGPRWHSNL